jgi:hypothetical protein
VESRHLSLLSAVFSGLLLLLLLLLLFLLLLLLFLLLLLLLLLVLVLLLVLSLVQLLLLLSSNLVVELDIGLVVVVLLEILEGVLPDATEGSSGVGSDRAPGRLCAEELDALGPSGQGRVESSSGAGNAAKLADVVEGVVTEDVLCDERARVKNHDGLGLGEATVGDDGALGEDVLLELVAEAVVDGNLDLLHDKHDGADLLELILEVGLAEQVVQVVVEAVVDLVNDEDLVDLLDNLLLEAVVDDLKVLLLDLDDLLLLVEVVEAISKVEAVALEAVHNGAVEAIAEDVGALGDRGRDGASSWVKVSD